MKSKLSKIMGIGFALVLVASMMLFAIPVAADPYENLHPPLPNMWQGFPPTPGAAGFWFFDPAITQVGPLAQAINGDLYAYVATPGAVPPATPNNPVPGGSPPGTDAGSDDIFKSTDDGRTWTVSSVPAYYGGGPVVDMVCSSMSEDVIYLTDGNYVYRSINGGVTFTLVAAEDLEFELMGTCGSPITDLPITSIDVGYDGSGQPMVFIGTRDVGENYDDTDAYPIVGSVYWIADQTFSADWRDLQVRCYGCCDWPLSDPALGCFDVYAVAAAPDFANISKAYAIVTAPLSGITFPLNTAAVVEVRAGDYGAIFNYDALPAGITCDVASGATMTANQVATFTATATHALDVNAITITDGTISWRLVSGAATFCGGTYALSTLGTVCSWSTVTEIRWDCLWSFEIQHASRIKFPSYYGTDPTLFVGVAAVNDQSGSGTHDGWGEGGDVYRVADTYPPSGCIDLNVQGFTTGCQGLAHANICSLDIENDALVAGAWDSYQLQSPTRVYYSADGGWTWSPSLKDPTGRDRCYVLFGGSIVAGTRYCNCAFSLDCGANPGQFFNGISLINMTIEEVLDMTHSPGYSVESSTLFLLTRDEDACQGPSGVEVHNLLRWDGTYWERVHSSRFFYALGQEWVNAPLYDWVEVSPDFNSTSTLYMANTGFYMTRSIDAGCSWAPLIYPCYDRPTISAWIVVDEETVLAAGADGFAGNVYRTINHGSQPWSTFAVLRFPEGSPACDGVDFDLSLPRSAESDLLLGDACGMVYFSGDLGATWAEIQDAVTGNFGGATNNTYVVFDPGYGIEGDPGVSMIYAAAGTVVGRCALDLAGALPFKQDWVYISATTSGACDPFALCNASGIDAAGDTALYVADSGAEASGDDILTGGGTMGVRYTCATGLCTCDLTVPDTAILTLDGTFQLNEPLSIIEYNLECDFGESVVGTILVRGLISTAMGTIAIDIDEVATAGCVACGPDGTAVEVLYSYLTVTAATSPTAACPTGVWRTLNPMDWMTPVSPLDKVEWEFLSLGEPHQLLHPEAGVAGALGVYPDDLWLTTTAASNVLWALDLYDGEDARSVGYRSYIFMWDDPLARPVIQIQPADGALLATTTTATIEWQPLDAALGYEVFIFSFCATCPDNMVVFDNFTTPLTCIVIDGLTPGTKYFWKVRAACDSPKVSKWSALRTFDTALDTVPFLCAPWCGQDDVILTTNFAWDPVIGAMSYEIQIVAASADGTADWTGVATYTSAENAFASIPGLEYSTVYYWRVRSVNGSIYSAWAVCLFTTADAPVEPVEPPPSVVVEQTEITPVWIWVIIAIGGALTIAVVILIVTTRRVP